jgi:hypothetical protein
MSCLASKPRRDSEIEKTLHAANIKISLRVRAYHHWRYRYAVLAEFWPLIALCAASLVNAPGALLLIPRRDWGASGTPSARGARLGDPGEDFPPLTADPGERTVLFGKK